MTQTAARQEVNKLREDLMWVAGIFQNEPTKIAAALQADRDTLQEYKRLVGDLFSLTEVVLSEAKEG